MISDIGAVHTYLSGLRRRLRVTRTEEVRQVAIEWQAVRLEFAVLVKREAHAGVKMGDRRHELPHVFETNKKMIAANTKMVAAILAKHRRAAANTSSAGTDAAS
jgi:hypothetical protein